MALELIDVGATANDGQGDPIRTAFEKCNVNFTQLFSTAGITGLANGSSNIQIPQANGNVNFSVGGTSNVLVITPSAANVFANFGVSGTSYLSNVEISGAIVSQGTIQTFADVTANVVTGQYTVNGGNAFIGNLTTTTDLRVLGNVNNDLNVVGNATAAKLSATGNVVGQYILGDGGFLSNVTVASNVAVTQIANGLTNFAVVSSGGNLVAAVNGSSVLVLSTVGAAVTGNLTSTNLSTGIISSSGNITSSANISGSSLIGTLVGSVTGASTVSASGNITGGNVLFGSGVVSGTGNITGGNVLFGSGVVSGTGNITAGNVNAVGFFATGDINSFNMIAGGDVIASGVVTATGNVQGQNLVTSGIIQSTGNLSAGNINTIGLVSGGNLLTNGNANVGNLNSSGRVIGTDNIVITSTGSEGGQLTIGWVGVNNITGQANGTWNLDSDSGNVFRLFYQNAANVTNVLIQANAASNVVSFPQSAGVSASGNITGGNLIGTLVGNVRATTISATGNITSGNAALGNLATATYFSGDGSLLTNLNAGSQITNGTSNVLIASSGGNVTVSVGGSANILSATSTGVVISGTASASGNITGGNLIGTLVGSVTGASTVSASGTITGGNLSTAGTITVNSGGSATAIINGGSNAVGNIGSSGNYFNRVFAQATTALYADLAELYAGDRDYEPGTVISFGGSEEVTISTMPGDVRIAGIVSTNPSYEMNAGLVAAHPIKVALQGRVPTKVTGTVQKGDMMVSAGNGYACSCSAPTFGSVLGKSLEDFDGVQGVIEIVVGRM